MPRCPRCEAENPSNALLCRECFESLAVDADDEEIRTHRTRPKSEPKPSGESLPGTLPLSQVPVVDSPASDVPEAPPTGPPIAARLLSAAAALAPAAPEQAPPDLGPRWRLRVQRGLRINAEYPIYEGANMIGRRDDRPIDIDLEGQEQADRIWSSRQHAIIHRDNGALSIEDLNSLNGTFVNRQRVYPGVRKTLVVNDIVQIGTIQMKVVL